jgi:3-methyladenine DNA glycosylase/8-oxoguanine DNA glycosylase
MRLSLRIECPRRFCLRETVLSHGWFELLPFRWDDASSTLFRAEALPDGSRHLYCLRQSAGLGGRLSVRWLSGVPSPAQRRILLERIRRITNLSVDLSPFLSICRKERRLRYVPRRGAGRFLRCGNLYEEVFKAICGTNIAWKQAVLAVNRVASLGERVPGTEFKAFPDAEKLLGMGERRLKEISRLGYRVPYLLAWARRVLAAEPEMRSVERGEWTVTELKRFLLDIQGVGKATAQYLLMVWGHGEEIPVDSSVFLYCRLNRFAGRAPTEKEIREIYEPYGAWKAYAYWFEFLPWAKTHWGLGKSLAPASRVQEKR